MHYGCGFAHLLDLLTDAGDARDAAAEFVAPLTPPGGAVLEIGAGFGRTAFALAQRGVRVTALEPDPDMFAVMESRLKSRPELHGSVSAVPQPAGFAIAEKFSVVTCFAVMHLLAPDERRALVGYAARQLASGGRFVLEVPMASRQRTAKPWALAGSRDRGTERVEQHAAVEVVGENEWATHWKFRVLRSGTVVEEVAKTFRWHAFTDAEIDALLSEHGFALGRQFGGTDRVPYVAGESRVRLVVARAGN